MILLDLLYAMLLQAALDRQAGSQAGLAADASQLQAGANGVQASDGQRASGQAATHAAHPPGHGSSADSMPVRTIQLAVPACGSCRACACLSRCSLVQSTSIKASMLSSKLHVASLNTADSVAMLEESTLGQLCPAMHSQRNS